MYIVTGGAGFIGSHIVKSLNERGITDILVVDDLENGAKIANLSDCVIADYMDYRDLASDIECGAFSGAFDAIFHQGACSNTMEYNGRYMMDVNYTFSKKLLGYAAAAAVPFIYASSAAIYGNSRVCREIPECERPINAYAYSKLAFDQHVRHHLDSIHSTVVGLRYFNVYGPRERFKGKMSSMVWHLFNQLRDTGAARLFEGTDGYPHGGQQRDFVFVGDVVAVNQFFAAGPVRKGIYNCGTGASRAFNDIASTLISLFGHGSIEYIPFDETLRGKYQSFTRADVSALRAAGYSAPFTSLEDGVARCYENWITL